MKRNLIVGGVQLQELTNYESAALGHNATKKQAHLNT